MNCVLLKCQFHLVWNCVLTGVNRKTAIIAEPTETARGHIEVLTQLPCINNCTVKGDGSGGKGRFE